MSGTRLTLRLLLRRLRSAALLAGQRLRSWRVRFNAHQFQDGIAIARGVHFGSDVILSATDGGSINIADGAGVGRVSRVVAREGSISIGKNVFLGDGCFLVSLASISIGEGTQVAEYVVIRDQDHAVNATPFASGMFRADPIVIGKDCWIGAKATVLRGANIGDGSVIGAHSVVRGVIPPNCLAVGVPARVVKELPSRRHGAHPDDHVFFSDADATV